ncbi:MAG TPA: LuxR C-terminal-related transcriptional regulator [Mycobacteriales bacterium]|nr:LuxR C-terminal-related transcriptional regulator [Mycobacteriales bacterium]
MIVGRDEQVVALASALNRPGLSVVTGGPGSGKTALARQSAQRAGRQLLEAGALSSLRMVPALPLARAIRAAVPADDPPLAVEAVRARLGGAALLLDDAHWADRYTLAVLPELARHVPVVAAVRLPGPLGPPALAALRRSAAYWCALAPLDGAAAARVVRQVRADLPDPVVRGLIGRCGGNPLALRVLARTCDQARADVEPLRGVAEMVADLPLPERTALAALGLLGRPAPAALLGAGRDGLLRAGLVTLDRATGLVTPTEGFVAEVAAGVLPDDQRRALHRRLAALVDDHGEAARHLVAAGDRTEAAGRALRAAEGSAGDARAEHLALAVTWLDGRADPDLVLTAAEAALQAGRPALTGRLVEPLHPADAPGRVRRAVLLSESLARCGEPHRAAAVLRQVAAELPGLDPTLRGRHAVASVYAALAGDPEVACALAAAPLAELGPAAPPRLWAAYGAALLGAGRPGWQDAVRAALNGARGTGDLAGECAAGAVLVAGLREGLRTADAGALATELADRAAARGAYSLEVTFRAEALWADLHAGGISDDLIGLAGTLLARATPPDARALLAATLALAQADTGAIPAARAVLREHASGGVGQAAGGPPADRDRLARWVAAETALLDGDPARAAGIAGPLTGRTEGTAGETADLAAGLARLTLAWCAPEGAAGPDPANADLASASAGPEPVRTTLAAWATGQATAFGRAADQWDGVMVRERVRCLLAAGETGGELDCLLAAESAAERAGLVLLLGRTRRALRRHGVTRGPAPVATPAGPMGLSAREWETLALVGQGHSTRRIAELLGLTRNTTETYVKQAMSKLGARTRTEAAVRAAALAGSGTPDAGVPAGQGSPGGGP